MELDPDHLKFLQIFQAEALEAQLSVAEKNSRFVHYTSADTAIKIIGNRELWLRNATVMNDYSEISHGLELIHHGLDSPEGEEFKAAVDGIFPETRMRVSELVNGWAADWRYETYISCLSLHEDHEDELGRLSMWRAYGDVALVVNNTPMVAVTDKLGVFSIPVMYQDLPMFRARLKSISEKIKKEEAFLREAGEENLTNHLFHFFLNVALGTKHPGFAEEKEWRIFYRPAERKSEALERRLVVIGGIPQDVWVLHLEDNPEKGLYSADIPNLLNRVIVGPTEHPYVSVQAFRRLLEKVGVENAHAKVTASTIPLRSK